MIIDPVDLLRMDAQYRADLTSQWRHTRRPATARKVRHDTVVPGWRALLSDIRAVLTLHPRHGSRFSLPPTTRHFH